MGRVPWAANDPIFWLHHCNIDRVWASWNKAGGKNPTDQVFLDEQFVFADRNGHRAAVAVKELIDGTPASYVYDKYLERPDGSPPFPPAVDNRFATMNIVSPPSANGIRLGTGPVRVQLSTSLIPTPAPRKGNAFSAMVASRLPTQRFILRLEDLRAVEQPGIGYDIYLNLAENAQPTRSDLGYAGTVNMFAVVAHRHHAGHSASSPVRSARNRSLDVTETVKGLQAAGRNATDPTVTLVPTGEAIANSGPSIGRIALLSV
jgi:tyrosinase